MISICYHLFGSFMIICSLLLLLCPSGIHMHIYFQQFCNLLIMHASADIPKRLDLYVTLWSVVHTHLFNKMKVEKRQVLSFFFLSNMEASVAQSYLESTACTLYRQAELNENLNQNKRNRFAADGNIIVGKARLEGTQCWFDF